VERGMDGGVGVFDVEDELHPIHAVGRRTIVSQPCETQVRPRFNGGGGVLVGIACNGCQRLLLPLKRCPPVERSSGVGGGAATEGGSSSFAALGDGSREGRRVVQTMWPCYKDSPLH